jgi:uncharacterized protein (TIGR02246 family)
MRSVARTMLGGLVAAGIWCVGAGTTFVADSQTSNLHSADEAAVFALVRDVERTFNEGDAAAIAQLYDPDGDRRDASGAHAKGRAEVKEMYEAGFRARQTRRNGPANQTRFDGEVRFLGAGVALVDGFYTAADGRRGPYTLVVIKNDDRWLITAGRAGALIR